MPWRLVGTASAACAAAVLWLLWLGKPADPRGSAVVLRGLTPEVTPNVSGNVTARRLDVERYRWKCVTENAGFSARYNHAAIFDQRQQIFVVAGATADFGMAGTDGGGGYLNDVWMSSDKGHTWEEIVPRSERFSPRRSHALVTGGRGVVMYLLGGFCGKDCVMNDWWSSEKGSVWNNMGKAPWRGRHGHVAVVTLGENLVMFGGHDGSSYLNDAWSIQDPAQALVYSKWIEVCHEAPWAPRYGHAAVIDSRDAIFLLGGFASVKALGIVDTFNDVWRSDDDGRTWQSVSAHASWSGRYQHTAAINGDDHIFVLGGIDGELARCNDAWRSRDGGAVWEKVTPAAPWPARYEHAVVVDEEGTIYILGGVSTGSSKFNDVWRSERMCADDVYCDFNTICRDGTAAAFEGMPEPKCVNICDRRIFDDCDTKELCEVRDQVATCVDPCETHSCDEGFVCEVAPRDGNYKGRVLPEAQPYCLACANSKTKYACDALRECEWSHAEEACLTRCKVLLPDECDHVKRCDYNKKDGSCVDHKD